MKLLYDVASAPNDMAFEDILKLIAKNNLVLYDSSKGQKPEFLAVGNDYFYDSCLAELYTPANDKEKMKKSERKHK